MKPFVIVAGLVTLTCTCLADNTAEFLSGNGFKLYLAYGVYHAFQSNKEEGTRALDTLLTTGLFAEGLKKVTRVERPDHSDHDSFPSGHATAAFAIATIESEYHPKEAALWYLGAGLIAQSRVDLDRHHTTDILAGAAIGYFGAKAEVRSKGFLIQPTATGATLLGYSMRF